MEEELSSFARLICDPKILTKDEDLKLRIDRQFLYHSAEYQAFSETVNSIRGIENLVKARGDASKAYHGDIARQMADDAISYCWKRSSLTVKSLLSRFLKQIEDLTRFRERGCFPTPMAMLL